MSLQPSRAAAGCWAAAATTLRAATAHPLEALRRSQRTKWSTYYRPSAFLPAARPRLQDTATRGELRSAATLRQFPLVGLIPAPPAEREVQRQGTGSTPLRRQLLICRRKKERRRIKQQRRRQRKKVGGSLLGGCSSSHRRRHQYHHHHHLHRRPLLL